MELIRPCLILTSLDTGKFAPKQTWACMFWKEHYCYISKRNISLHENKNFHYAENRMRSLWLKRYYTPKRKVNKYCIHHDNQAVSLLAFTNQYQRFEYFMESFAMAFLSIIFIMFSKEALNVRGSIHRGLARSKSRLLMPKFLGRQTMNCHDI